MDLTGKISLWRLSPWEEINPTKEEKRDVLLFLSKISKEVFLENLPRTRYSRILHGSLFSLSRRIYVLLFPQAAAEVVAEITANTPTIDQNTPRLQAPSISEEISHLPSQTASTDRTPLGKPAAIDESQPKTLKESALALLQREIESVLVVKLLKILFFQTSENIPKMAALPTVENLTDGTKKITLIFDREGTIDMQQTLKNQAFVDLYIQKLKKKGLAPFFCMLVEKVIQSIIAKKADQFQIKGEVPQQISFIWNPLAKTISYPEKAITFTSSKGLLSTIRTIEFKENTFFVHGLQEKETIATLVKEASGSLLPKAIVMRQLEESTKKPKTAWTLDEFQTVWPLFVWS